MSTKFQLIHNISCSENRNNFCDDFCDALKMQCDAELCGQSWMKSLHKKNVMSYNIVKEFDGFLFVLPQYYFILHDHNYSVMPAMTSCSKLRSFIFCSWVENRPKIISMGIATQLNSTRRDRIRFIRTKRNQTILILQLLDVRSIRDSWRWINIYTNIF